MAGYPYNSPPPPSPPCNDTTPTLPPPPPPPPPPPACNHTTTPTLSPLKSPPPPAQSHYHHPPPPLPPASPTQPPPPPPPSSYYSPQFSPPPPKSLRPPSSPQPSPPPYSSYPHYSPPPPSSPCNTTTPTLQTPPPPPPPACTCNKTTPTSPSPPPPSSYYPPPLASLSPPPPSTHYSPPLHSPPHPSHSPPPSPACNETTKTLPPPPPPPPPPSQHLPPPPSPYYSPPQPSLSPTQLPTPPSSPPPLSPPSPSPSPSPAPSPSFSTPSSPPPSVAPPTFHPHKLRPPLISPSPPPPSVSPPCHCVCPSPWAPPPNNYYPSIAPNYYPSMAPSPQFLSPSNGHRTVVLTTFVSLGGVFFLAFITIGLLSMAIKKRMPSMPTMGQSGTHEGGQGPVRTSESIPTTSAYSVINIPDQKPISETLEESNDSNKRLPKRTPPSSVNDITQGKDQESIGDDSNKKLGRPLDDQNVRDNMDASPDADSEPIDDEEKLDERNSNTSRDVEQESNADQVGSDKTTEDVEQESKAAEDEPNDSKKRFRPRPRKKNNDSKGKHGERKSSKLVGQVMKVATNFDLDGEEEYQGDDIDDVQEVPQDEDESNANEEKSDERNGKPVGNQSETQAMEQESKAAERNSNTTRDVEQQSKAAEDEPNDSKKQFRPRPRKKNNDSKGKHGERKSSKLVGQVMKVATNFDLDGEEEYQGDDIDDVQEVLQDEDESNANEEKSDERNGKPVGNQSETQAMEQESKAAERNSNTTRDVEQESNADQVGSDNTTEDVEQESKAAEDEPSDSKKQFRPRPRKKNNDSKGKHGERKSSKLVGQVMKVATNFDLDGEEEYQGDDIDDVQEVPQDEDESNANEEKSDERNGKPVGNQSEAQAMEQESSAVENESKNSKGLHPHKRSPSSGLKGQQGERKSSTLVGQAFMAAINVDLVGALQPQDYDNDEAEEEESSQDMEQESSEVEKESKNSKGLRPHKRSPSSRLKGQQGERKSSTLVGQAMKAAVNVDLVGALQPQDYDNDEAEEEQSYRGRNELPNLGQNVTAISGDNLAKEFKSFRNADDKEESEAYSSNQDLHHDKRHSSTQGREQSSNFGKKFSATIGANQGEVLKSLDVDQILTAPVGGGDPGLADDNEKEETDDPVNECDDPNIGYELLVDDDAKEEKSNSFGSKKDSRLHKRPISARGRRDPRILQIWTDPLGGDPGTYFKSFADDDEKEEKEDQGMECDDTIMEFESLVDDGATAEKSESFGLEKVTKSQIGDRGRKGPPNVSQILNIPTGSGAGVDLKFLAGDDEKEEKEDTGKEWESVVDVDDKQKELELFGRKEVSRLHKRQTGAGRRRQPPNLGQIWTATTGSDPSVDLNSGATQVWASNIDESMTVRNDDDPFGELESHDDDGEGDLSGTATNEGDQNADMEFHEEDPELESECSNRGLGLHKPHALSLGETEPSTDDQSVFVTGDDDPDESGKVARSGKPLSRPRTTGVGGKRRT